MPERWTAGRRRRGRVREDAIGWQELRTIAPEAIADAPWQPPQATLAPLGESQRAQHHIACGARYDDIGVGVVKRIQIGSRRLPLGRERKFRLHHIAVDRV